MEERREKNLKLYRAILDELSDIELKGKTMPYTSVNGHMFSILSKEGVLGVRLSKEERESFLETHQTSLLEQYGKVMKEYVVVPDELLSNVDEMKNYFLLSYEYVSGLKPK